MSSCAASPEAIAAWMKIQNSRAIYPSGEYAAGASTQVGPMNPVNPIGQPERTTATAAKSVVADRHVESSITTLVDQYAGTLYRVAYSVLRNAADAEDAVQETYLRVLRHQDKLGEIRDPRVWMVRIVWNVVLDRKRRSKTRPETDDIADLARMLPAAGFTAEERVASAQHHASVLRAVELLPAKEQRVLILSAFEELSSVEIAQVLGTTESTVRSRLFRARKLLATLLSQSASQPLGQYRSAQ